jgi:hypothetical protein
MRVIIMNEDYVAVYADRHATIRITTKNPNTKLPVNITGALLVFQVKEDLITGSTALFELKNELASGTGVEDYMTVSGVYKLHITPDHLTGLSINGTYWCETKMTSGGKDSTIFQKKFKVVPTLVD